MFSLPHLIRRVSRQRLVSASVMLGIALAVALGVAVPLATAALASMGLRATVEALPRSSQNIQLTRRVEPFDAAFQQRLQRRLGDLIGYSYTVSYTPILDARRETPVLAAPVRLRTQGGLIEHSVVTGRVPRPRPLHRLPPSEQGCNEASPVEVLVSAEQLAANSLAVGDQLCIGSILPAIITGSFVPRNLEEDYWFGDHRPVRGEIDPTPPDQLIVVLMLAEEDFASVAPVFGGEPGTHIYRALVRTAAINLDTLDDVDSRLRTFRTDANTLQPRPIVLTGLDRAIVTFHTRFQLLQSALAALLLGLLTLAIVYVVFVGALATERQS
ncbi:MAG: hypothetical protein M3380_18300, partial [Chloroflexota bacterium]|nr:hypothetical protein [Chloroflexota bacterium]